jgi:hypothetical protein
MSKSSKPYAALIWGVILILLFTSCSALSAQGLYKDNPQPTPCPGGNCNLARVTSQPAASTNSQVMNLVVPSAVPTHGQPVTQAQQPTPAPVAAAGSAGVPNFSHVIIIIMENEEYSSVIDNVLMPNLNKWAKQYTLLSQYYAVTHPSLPNYIALTSGDTHNIKSDCTNCFLNSQSLPDLIEASGRTWKAYMEDMPSPCFIGDQGLYAQKHDPFIYYNSIRNNQQRCQNIVPMTQLASDLSNNQLPNYSWISPNLCNSGHNCKLDTVDSWLGNVVPMIMKSPAFDKNSLLVLTFDEGDSKSSCCGLPKSAGGQIVTVLISPLVKTNFEDRTPYDHYSLVKTIAAAWGLEPLGHAADPKTPLILAPWK